MRTVLPEPVTGQLRSLRHISRAFLGHVFFIPKKIYSWLSSSYAERHRDVRLQRVTAALCMKFRGNPPVGAPNVKLTSDVPTAQ